MAATGGAGIKAGTGTMNNERDDDTDLAIDLRDNGQHAAADRIEELAGEVAALRNAAETHIELMRDRRFYWLREWRATRIDQYLGRASAYQYAAAQLTDALKDT